MFSLLLAIIYLAFISLGIPDSLLGTAWPTMHQDLQVPLSFAGGISIIISLGTIISSLQSDRLTRRLGAGRVSAYSVLLTAIALWGFSISSAYWMLCLWAIPYGLGAGSIDAALNNYIALHYPSRHMNWLHCMWGVGASIGPMIMSFAFSHHLGWNAGYLYIAVMQIALTAVIFFSLPLWKKTKNMQEDLSAPALRLREILRIPGIREILIAFFCYCGLEHSTGLWLSSYMVTQQGLSQELAAQFTSLFFLGITIGRALSGFLSYRLNDTQMIRYGCTLIILGIIGLLLPLGTPMVLIGILLIGLGSAPVYPSIIHSTPAHFGAHCSQAVIGVEMACAYIGTLLMPPLFGVLSRWLSLAFFPIYLLFLILSMIVLYERMLRKIKTHR